MKFFTPSSCLYLGCIGYRNKIIVYEKIMGAYDENSCNIVYLYSPIIEAWKQIKIHDFHSGYHIFRQSCLVIGDKLYTLAQVRDKGHQELGLFSYDIQQSSSDTLVRNAQVNVQSLDNHTHHYLVFNDEPVIISVHTFCLVDKKFYKLNCNQCPYPFVECPEGVFEDGKYYFFALPLDDQTAKHHNLIVFNIATNNFSTILLRGAKGKLPPTLIDNSFTFTDNHIYICGGALRKNHSKQQDSVWRMCRSSYEWEKKLPFPISKHVCCIIGEKLFIIGGIVKSITNNKVVRLFFTGNESDRDDDMNQLHQLRRYEDNTSFVKT